MAATQATLSYRWSALVVCAVLWGLAPSGCATQQATAFQRARPLQPGHAEVGLSLAMAREPTRGAHVVIDDQGSDGESLMGLPAPAAHFWLGVAEDVDLGLQASPGGAQVSVKYGILDDDSLMMAVVGSVGMWSSRLAAPGEDDFEAYSPLTMAFDLPLATRLMPGLELNLSPTLGFAQVVARRDAYLEEQQRSFATLATGFRLGVNIAVWRVRINPEVALLGCYRADREEGFFGVYPGIAAFFTY